MQVLSKDSLTHITTHKDRLPYYRNKGNWYFKNQFDYLTSKTSNFITIDEYPVVRTE